MADLNKFEEQISEASLLPDCSYRIQESVVVNNEILTPKSQKQNTDGKRWASVVKGQKTNVYSPDSSSSAKSCKKLSYKIADTGSEPSQVFLEDYENHKGFIAISTCKTCISCKICSLELNSIPDLTNHLKTRKHEDKIIEFLKSHIPPHLGHTMEFVSFSGSKLCCNLCKKEVEMSAENPHETILNIIAHNTDIVHSSEKYNHPYSFTHAHNIVQKLAEIHSDIKNNIHFIDKKMMPLFKCKLCDKNIFFNEDLEKLAKHFTNHLLSQGHLKNRKTVQILQQFSDSRTNEKEYFTLKQGDIFCTCCELEVEADLEKLISHDSGFEHSKNKLMRQDRRDYAQMAKQSKFENNSNEEKTASFDSDQITKTLGPKEEKKEESDLVGEEDLLNSKLKAMFDTLQNVPPYLKNLNHFKINEKNSITCFICERIVPPSSYNIKTHILGNNHRTNFDVKHGNQTAEESQGLTIKQENIGTKNEFSSVENVYPSSSGHLRCSNKKKHDLYIFLDNQQQNSVQNKSNKHEIECNHMELENIPKSLRAVKCRKPKTLPLRLVNKKFDALVRKSAIIRANKDILDINVDGINGYCKLCKVLIPLTLNVEELEAALLLHLQKKRHLENLSKLNEENSEANKKYFSPDITSKTSFFFSNTSPKLPKTQSTKNMSNITPKLSTKSSSKIDDCANSWRVEDVKQDTSGTVKDFKDIQHLEEKQPIFVFGKENVSTQEFPKESHASKSPAKLKKPNKPAIKTILNFKIESETDEETLKRREKQIKYGKCTDSYQQYVQRVPLLKRQPKHPFTPPKYMKCSRRTWDGLIKVWRRHLHAWDSDSETKTTSIKTLEADIQPLSDLFTD